jgi:hypothetical protein
MSTTTSTNTLTLAPSSARTAPLTLLTLTPLPLTLPFALATYFFVAHTLNAPAQVLAGGDCTCRYVLHWAPQEHFALPPFPLV